MKTVLTIAGSDPSGGAGIQADIKTITMQGCYAMSAITALTVQNTTGVFAVLDMEPGFVAQQIDAVFSDIRPDVVKIGMVSSVAIIEVIAERLQHWQAEQIVLDPVMVATSKGKLLQSDAVESLVEQLLPLATLLTPNLPEAEVLCGRSLNSDSDMEYAARMIAGLTPGAVLLKGGHRETSGETRVEARAEACDLLYYQGEHLWLRAPYIDTNNTHGTGCTLSSAIACGLATNQPLEQAVRQAKEYVSAALSTELNLGAGTGPIDHLACCCAPPSVG